MNLINLRNALVFGTSSLLFGCASIQTGLEHKDLQVASQQSESIFTQDVPSSQRKVYFSYKNTSDQDIDIRNKVINGIKSHGYKIVSNPNHAHFILKAQILKIGEMIKSARESALGGGYGSAVTGVATGVAAAAVSDSANVGLAAGIAGGLIDMAANSLVKNTTIGVVTDIEVSERVNGVINEQTNAHVSSGSSTATSQSYQTRSNLLKHRTRIVSTANKVNLKYAEAKPALENSLAKVISGIF